MTMSAMVISIILTIIVLLLTLLTISQGYGYKHKVDPPVKNNEFEVKPQQSELKDEEGKY